MRTFKLTILALVAVLGGVGVVAAQEPQEPVTVAPETPPPSRLPSLAPVIWEGQPISFEGLRGKTVVVLVYATWCPKCNAWSKTLFTQMKEAIRGKPVFVLAINVDDRLDPTLSYVKQRGFVAPNILHGYDPSMTRRLGLKSNLFNYVVVAPDGTLGGRGSAGMFFDEGKTKQFVVARQLATAPGEFTIFRSDMPEAVQWLLWPMELGRAVPDAVLLKGRAKLDEADRPILDKAINEFLDGRIEEVRKLYVGELPDKLSAYEKAEFLATTYPKTLQGKAARQGLTQLGKDRDFKRELAAKKQYDALMMSAADPVRIHQGLRSMVSRFRGTHYGNLAAETIEER